MIIALYTQKENVDNLLRLRLLRYRQTPILLKRVLPTPASVNSYFRSCNIFDRLAIYQKTRI
jgi:hypothetical protein